MPQPKVPPSERIGSSYKQIKAATPELHAAAHELFREIKKVNKTLEPLSIGITVWHTIASGEDENGNYWSRSIGYNNIGQEWGIALRQASGNNNYDSHDESVWEFSKAPRWMVIESVAKLPDLFETIIERVKETTAKLKARAQQARELVAAIQAAAAEPDETEPSQEKPEAEA